MRMEELAPPGARVATIEEFEPAGEYVVKDGNILVTKPAKVEYDKKNKVVKIAPLRREPIRIGDTVVGKVVHVQGPFAYVDIYTVNGERLKGEMTGLIYISGDKGRPPFNVGSIIRARVVINNAGHYILSLDGEGLGVVEAYCSVCGGPLERSFKGALRCQWCGRVYRFKVAPDFRPRRIYSERVVIE